MPGIDTRFSALIQRVHDAALEPDGWRSALASLAAELGASQVFLYARDAVAPGPLQPLVFHGVPAALVANMTATLATGVVPGWIRLLPVGIAQRSSDWQSDRAFARSTFYNEAVRPLGGFHASVALLPPSKFRQVYVVAARARGAPDFDVDDVAKLQMLLPHLTSALRTSERLVEADLRTAGAAGVLDRLQAGVVLLDAVGAIIFANRTAEGMLNRGGLASVGGRIAATRASADWRLQKLIANCVSGAHAGGAIELPRDNGRPPLHVQVTPARSRTDQSEMRWLGCAQAGAILIVTDPDCVRAACQDELRRCLGLTPTEAAVALEIVKGDGRQAAALRLGISVSTVRTHLGHIFEKTGVRRQAELVGIVGGLMRPPTLAD